MSDWHQLWFTSADSSGNGHRLNTSRPSIPQGAFGGGGVRVSQIKKSGKLSNGWTDRHQIGHTSADPPGNGYTPNKLLLETQGGTWWGEVRGQTFKSLGKLSNGWTDWHQLWFTSADSSGNEHRLNPSRPSIFMGVNNSKAWEMWSKGWTDWEYILHMYKCCESWNGHRLNKLAP